MSLGKRPGSAPRRPSASYGQSGPPAWLVFLVGVALVFGSYYLWMGFRQFASSGGLAIQRSTDEAQVVTTATAESQATQTQAVIIAPPVTRTAIPACEEFRVTVPVANLRSLPALDAPVLEGIPEGDIVCVISRSEDWYLIDRNTRTRSIEEGYMFYNIIEAVNPTPTPSLTWTPAPTVTQRPTEPPTSTPSPAPTLTPDPAATAAPTVRPSPQPTPTPGFQSA